MATTLDTRPPAAGLASDRVDEEGWPILRPTKLTVSRTSPDDVKDRQVILYLNGDKVATLLYGQTFSREILPGKYSLRANNTLVWKTVEFDAAPGEDVQFKVVNKAPGGLFYMLFLFGVSPLYVTLERTTGDEKD